MTTSKTETFNVDYKKEEILYDYGEVAEYPTNLYRPTHVMHNGITGFDKVTDAHVAQFHDAGYLVIHDAFSHSEVEGGVDGLLDLIGGKYPDYKGVMFEKKAKGIDVKSMPPEQKQDYVRKFMWFADYDKRLNAMAYHPKLLSVVSRIMGGETPSLFQDMALIKPPRIGREKPWHQDHAYFDLPLTTTVVGVWVALDEATVENGCMVICPGSHRQGPVIHFQRRDWQICDTYDRQTQVLAVPLKPGGCLLFHSLIQHGTPANATPTRRRAVQFHYKPAPAEKTGQAERLAIFGSEGKDVTC